MTLLGALVEYAIITVFSISSILFLQNTIRSHNDFYRWHGLALGLIAVGVTGNVLQERIGDPINWVARLSQYLGGVYMLAAVITQIRRSGEWILPWERALRQTEEKYRLIVTKRMMEMAGSDPDFLRDRSHLFAENSERLITFVEHTRDGAVLRKLAYFPLLDDECTPGWVCVQEEPEPWETEVFFNDRLLRWTLDKERATFEFENRLEGFPAREAEIRQYWQNRRIATGEKIPPCDGMMAMRLEEALGLKHREHPWKRV